MSLTTRLMAALGVLGIALSGLLIADLLPAQQQIERATVHRSLNGTSSALLELAGALARERGLTAGLLAAPDQASGGVAEQIAASRTAAAAALDRSLAGLPGAASSDLRARLAELSALRTSVDRFLATKTAPPSPRAFFAAATGMIEVAVATRRVVDTNASTEAVATRLITLRDRLAEMSEFGGRLRGSVNGLIGRGTPATPSEVLQLAALDGRIDGAWSEVDARAAFEPLGVRTAIEAVRASWFGSVAALRSTVLHAAAEGAAWPVSSQVWFQQLSTGIDTMLAAQRAASAEMDAALDAERQAARLAAIKAAALLLAGLAVVGSAGWFIFYRVTSPLRQVVGVINRLVADDLDAVPPEVRGNDEIGQLCIATARFRDTARQARLLQQTQAQADAKAAGERADAIREIGARIERMTQSAMETVQASTAQVVEVSGRVHTTIAGIARDVRDATGDASQCRQSAQIVAGNADELNSAIQEIAQQMDRAAAATRSAVEQTEAARGTFDALQANVHEIGDVAALIAEIAGRTNLLALNATIEAARAGDAGKGFAVVAGEVKSLALETARSTERIRQRIDSIYPVTRDALQAMSGIGRAVTDIDAIATAVAAAAEQQSVAVAAVSESASQSSAASERMSGRMDLVSQDATRCEATMGEMAQVAQEIDGSVSKLKSDLVKILREQVDELDRRSEIRHPVSMPATVEIAGVVYQGRIKDLSVGGARFVSVRPVVGSKDAIAVLAVEGLPRAAVRIAGEEANSLHLQWSAPSEELQRAVAGVIGALRSTQRRAA